MSYVIIRTDMKYNQGNSIDKDKNYYVYDTTDSTIEQCNGEDICLLIDNNREFLNYRFPIWHSMYNVCITHPKLGIILRGNKLYVACLQHTYEFFNVRAIRNICISNKMLLIGVVDSQNCVCDIVISKLGCKVNDYYVTTVSYKSYGEYMGEQADVEVLRLCI